MSELRKAIQLTTGDGAALLPYDLDPVLHIELLEAQPLLQLLSTLPGLTKTHEYNLRSSHPQAWFEGEVTPMNQKASAYVRKTVQLKILRIWGGVSGFARSMDEAFIDALSAELEGSVQGMADIVEWSTLYGIANDVTFTGDPYQFSGILPRVYAYAPGNVINAAGAKITLDMLDQATATSTKFRQIQNDTKFWSMDFRMKQIVDGLQSRVQIPLKSLELFDGKLIMDTYDGIPIFETNMVNPAVTSTSPTDLGATEDSGAGTLAADTYYYNISSIGPAGEHVAGTEANVVMTGGSDAVDLAWTADATALAYMIWRGLTTGNINLQLIDIIPAKTYDSAGTVNGTVAAYKDTGLASISTVEPLSTGERVITLINSVPKRGAAYIGKIDDMGRPIANLVSYVDLARTKDSYDYMLKSYFALRLVHPNLVSVIRNVKIV